MGLCVVIQYANACNVQLSSTYVIKRIFPKFESQSNVIVKSYLCALNFTTL